MEQPDKTPEWSKQDGDVWTYEYRSLDKFDAEGKTITYTVTEAVPAGYGGYQDPENPFNFTNIRDEVTSLHGRKTWSDKNNQDGMRPESVTVQLMQSIGGAAATPVEGQTRVMSAENDWTYNFERIPGYDQNGDAIVYTVKEIDLPEMCIRDRSKPGASVTSRKVWCAAAPKRSGRSLCTSCWQLWRPVRPVSYTHLDVYKRQGR